MDSKDIVTPTSQKRNRAQRDSRTDREPRALKKHFDQSSPSQERTKKVKIEPENNPTSTPVCSTKCVILKYNQNKAISNDIAGAKAERESSPGSDNNSPEPISPFLFVPTKYWIDLEDPDKLFKVSSSPREVPTWRTPVAEPVRCGISVFANEPFSEQKSCNLRTAYLPVFLTAQTSRPYYRFQSSVKRQTTDNSIVLDRPFLEEKARLETTRSLLQRNLDDIEAAFANYTAAMSQWRSETRHWEVQTIRDEIEAGNTIIFRNKITHRDLDELDEWLRVEEQKESEGQYGTWYCGVLRLGHSNVYPPSHVARSCPIKDTIEERMKNLREAINCVEELIEDLERKPVVCSSSSTPLTPKPLIGLPECISDDEQTEPDGEHLAALTVWAYERHLHWIPRDNESKKKYKLRTEDDVYSFFRIKKLTSSDSFGTAGNHGLFREHIRIPQDLARYPWGQPFHMLNEAIPLAGDRRQLYTEEARILLRDMEAEYFIWNEPSSTMPDACSWSPSAELANRIFLMAGRLSQGPSNSDSMVVD